MKKRHSFGEIKAFVLKNVSEHSEDIASLTAGQFGITSQGANLHLQRLVREGDLRAEGATRSRRYFLARAAQGARELFPLDIGPGLAEDRIWRERVEPFLRGLKPNVLQICQHGFTEIFNNVVDHAEGTSGWVSLERENGAIRITIADNGVGIFEKIKNACRLEDHRHAILELAKGKLTTDPEKHTGEGIFFTSRMFDKFSILSGKLYFSHFGDDDWLIEDKEQEQKGSVVSMSIREDSARTTQEVYGRYAAEADDYGFTRTHVPVSLAIYGDENLVSRSQAKRLLARFDRFKEVFLDFEGVRLIGPPFADEIFRVFRNAHPETKLTWIRANPDVEKVIRASMVE